MAHFSGANSEFRPPKPLQVSLIASTKTSIASTARLMVIDKDARFREAVRLSLLDQSIELAEFESAEAALDALAVGERVDLILIDWHAWHPSAVVFLQQLRANRIDAPVVFVGTAGIDDTEAAALAAGAVDFISKGRSPSILAKRLTLVLQRAMSATSMRMPEELMVRGSLTLRLNVSRAFWYGRQVDLTLTRFNIVHLLASRQGAPVSYREIYDVVHRHGFIAGNGIDGFRPNVRTLVKRIRQNFRAIDAGFTAIENHAGIGYRWQDDIRDHGSTAVAV